MGRFIRGPDDVSKVVVETCNHEVVEYNKTVVFDSHLYIFIVYKLYLLINCFDMESSAARLDGKRKSNIWLIFVIVGPVFIPEHFDRVHLEI